MDSLLELFCKVDDFCQKFELVWNKRLLASGKKRRERKRNLSFRSCQIKSCLLQSRILDTQPFKPVYGRRRVGKPTLRLP